MRYEKIVSGAGDLLTGTSLQWELRYERLYGPGKYSEIIEKNRQNLGKRYLAVLVASLLIIAFMIADYVAIPYGGLEIEGGRVVSIKRPETGSKALELMLELENENGSYREKVVINLDPAQDGDDSESAAEPSVETDPFRDQIEDAVRRVEKDPSRVTVTLPDELADGTALYWSLPEKKMNPAPLVIGPLLAFWVYRSRFDSLSRLEKVARESVMKELPEFINKLVLLMNSGMVFYSAFEKVVTDRSGEGEQDYFYLQLYGLFERSCHVHSVLGKELSAFAKNTGVREFIRITNIINDNLSKGAELTRKLEGENDLLWFSRKKYAEEKGRLAETKMTLPLAILLLVLIMITVAPAVMDM